MKTIKKQVVLYFFKATLKTGTNLFLKLLKYLLFNQTFKYYFKMDWYLNELVYIAHCISYKSALNFTIAEHIKTQNIKFDL